MGRLSYLDLSDLEPAGITLPRGYSKFRNMDVFEDHAFISNETDEITLCKMTER